MRTDLTDPLAGPLRAVLDRLTGEALSELARRLASTGLDGTEQRAVAEGTAHALRQEVWRRVSRVLVLELNAARVTGQLTAATPEQRWEQWLAFAAAPEFWPSLAGRYPTLLPRLRRLIAGRCEASARLGARFHSDRAAISTLTGTEPRLIGLVPGQGDSHRGGQTVTSVALEGGTVVYKPRSLAVDRELARLLVRLLPAEPADRRIRVPRVVCRDGYGWAEHVAHEYCADDAELRCFYRGIGHWLAISQLLGAHDLHSENLIAAGPVPVVVDCETLFTPYVAPPASGYGHATDRAMALVAGSVLRTGLLPIRGQMLGLRGADVSAVGRLPGQQPELTVPTITGVGTDEARLTVTTAPAEVSANHPSPEPSLDRYWGAVVDSFTALTEQLHAWDRAGRLAELLDPLRACPIRVVCRDTVIYGELGRMLWHPVSLHQEARARRRAIDMLIKHGRAIPLASTEPLVIDAEVGDLLVGDVPSFCGIAGHGRLTGPAGVEASDHGDLVDAALRRWRGLDRRLQRTLTRSAVVSAYLNDTGPGNVDELRPLAGWRARAGQPMTASGNGRQERQRRQLTADMMRQIRDHTIRGDDGTVAWIALVLDSIGWQVRPLSADLYSGMVGVCVALAAYRTETGAGRADPVPGLPELLEDGLRTLRLAEDHAEAERAKATASRPEPPGAYVGLGSRIWGWLLLARLGAIAPAEATRRAVALAEQVPAAVAEDETFDLLTGAAGAIVPLLRLAELTGHGRWRDVAAQAGDRLAERAQWLPEGARWHGPRTPDGLGGMAHGVTGIGWALSRLAGAPGLERFAPLAEAALRYEQSLYDPDLAGWRDVRKPTKQAAPWWCHGAVGIGLVAADLMAHDTGRPAAPTLRHAATLCWRQGMDATHTLCHGDLGNWELLTTATRAGVGPDQLDQVSLDRYVLGSLTSRGPRCNVTVDVFVPGLLHGLSGMAYQLLRMHPDSELPSVLLPDPAGPGRLAA